MQQQLTGAEFYEHGQRGPLLLAPPGILGDAVVPLLGLLLPLPGPAVRGALPHVEHDGAWGKIIIFIIICIIYLILFIYLILLSVIQFILLSVNHLILLSII